MRQMPWGRDMLIVALSGWGQEADRARSSSAGFDHHFVKPVDVAEIQRLIDRSLASPGASHRGQAAETPQRV
jgi:CheY-like chemotaxis protein